MLRYNVAQLLLAPIGTTRSFQIEEEVFQTEELQAQNLHGDIRLTRLREEILLQGQLEVEVAQECSRCLEAYIQPLQLAFELEFQPSTAILTGKALPPPEDDNIYVIDGQHMLDLAEAIREQIILNLPMQPICRPDCAGFCSICGKNLNEGPCEGHAEETDTRLAVLATLLSPDRSSE